MIFPLHVGLNPKHNSWILERGELFEVVLFADLFEELVTNIFMARSKDGGSVFIPKSWCLAALRKKPSTRVYSLDHVRILINVGKEYLLQLLDSWRGGQIHGSSFYLTDDFCRPLLSGPQATCSGRRSTSTRTCRAHQ